MDSKSLLNFFAAQNAEIDILWFVIHFLLTALLSFLLAKAYVKFGNTLSNRVMFGKNFMILSMTTMLIITIVKSSVALSLGLVGALSIIRFRAAIKEPEELSYLFFAIAIGLGMGSQQAVITLVAFAVIALILWLRNMTRSDKVIPNLYLTIMGDISEGQDMMGSINQILASQGSDFRLKRLDEKKDSFEFSYQIQFPDIASIQACRQALRALDPDLKISLIDDRGIGGKPMVTANLSIFDSQPPAEDFRFERKYHIQDLDLHTIESWVRRSPCLFSECFPPRHINNIYFDTPSLENYHENLGGQAARTKLRLRWYGDYLNNPAKTTLEYKIKRGMVGTKDSYKLPPLCLQAGFSHDDMRTYWESCSLPSWVREDALSVVPTLGNRYRRKYFLSADGDYRITLDTDLCFLGLDRFDCQFDRIRTLDQSVVMELKYEGSIPTLDERLMNFFPFRVTRMSKYVTGIELLQG